MTHLEDDPWVTENSPISPAKMHALGCMIFYWNVCEFDAKEVFWIALGGKRDAAKIIFDEIRDRSLWEKTISLMNLRNFRPEFIEMIEHGRAVYERCKLNRNAFVHFTPVSSADPSDDGSALRLHKQRRQILDSVPLHDELQTIRRVADDCKSLHHYFNALFMNHIVFKDGNDEEARYPLPKKLPLPDFVWAHSSLTQQKTSPRPQKCSASRGNKTK